MFAINKHLTIEQLLTRLVGQMSIAGHSRCILRVVVAIREHFHMDGKNIPSGIIRPEKSTQVQSRIA